MSNTPTLIPTNHATALGTIQCMFEQVEQGMFPKDEEGALKSVATHFAHHMQETGCTKHHKLDNELFKASTGERGLVECTDHNSHLHRPLWLEPKHGWVVAKVATLSPFGEDAVCTTYYAYSSPNKPARNVAVPNHWGYSGSHMGISNLVVVTTSRHENCCIGIYLGCKNPICCMIGDYRMTKPIYVMEPYGGSGPCKAAVAYKTGFRLYTTLPEEKLRCVHTYSFETQSIVSRRAKLDFDTEYCGSSPGAVLDTDCPGPEATRDYEALLKGLQALTSNKETKKWSNGGLAATLALHTRLRSKLLWWREKTERSRAADPVRKCAACAIEAVKSQLALGIAAGPKRQRIA